MVGIGKVNGCAGYALLRDSMNPLSLNGCDFGAWLGVLRVARKRNSCWWALALICFPLGLCWASRAGILSFV